MLELARTIRRRGRKFIHAIRDKAVLNYRIHWRTYHKVMLLKRMPLLVYSMPKSASSSVYFTLLTVDQKHVIYKLHTLSPKRIADFTQYEYAHGVKAMRLQASQIREHVLAHGDKVKCITLVRQPIDQKISWFFEKLYAFYPEVLQDDALTVDTLLKRFNDDLKHPDIAPVLDWFDEEYFDVLGINIYDFSFPHDDGYLRIETPTVDALILRVESPDAIKEQAIAQFTGIEDFTLRNERTSSSQGYGHLYKEFKKRLDLSPEFIDEMLNSQYTRHFYTDDEIAQARSKWIR